MTAFATPAPARAALAQGLGALALALVAVPGAWAASLALLDSQPLVPGSTGTPPPRPAGTRWTLDARGLRGPQPLACPKARQQILLSPAQGLFQGAWAAAGGETARQRAAGLGLRAAESVTLRLDCANASFDLHRAAPDRLLTVLDGRVLKLGKRPDAGDEAQAAVRELLLQHLSEIGRPFDAARVARLQAWLAPSLAEAFGQWFARPPNPDEAPQLDGDPFTDTQEPPLSLTLVALRQRGAQAAQGVEVDAGANRPHQLTYHLQRIGTADWHITDIEYGEGVTLRQLIHKELKR